MGRATYALTVKIGASQDASYRRNLNKAMKNLDSLESTARRVATGVATAFAAVNISRLVEDAVGTYSEFEQAMKNTAAIANATVSDYEKMEAAARAAGRATTKTATESAEAMGYMALAGWTAQDSVSGLMPILKLAESTEAELQQTSDLVTDSMSALGLSVKDIDTYLDMLIAGNNNANNTAIELMQSLTKTGGASKVLGASLEDTITAVGILANNGTKAEEAGTAMNSMLTRIATNDKALEALEKIGADIFDESGNFIGLRNTLVEIDKALSGMSTEDRTAVLKQIAGTRYFSRMEYLLDGVRAGADGAASAWDELEQKVVNSEGALDKMNAQVTDTLPAAWERVKSAISDTKIGVVDEFGDDATQMLDNIAQKIPEITDNITDFLNDNKKEIYDALETGGELLEKVSNTAVGTVAFLLDNESEVVGALTAIGSAMLIKRGIDAKNSIVAFANSLTTPLGVIAGLSAAVGVITGVTNAILKASEEAAYANLDEHFGNIVLSMEDLQNVAAQIVQDDDLEMIAQMLEAAGDTKDELRDVKRTLEEISGKSWKISAGFGFGSEESESYAGKIEDFVEQTQEYVDAKEYEIHVAASLLFGEGSEKVAESDASMRELDEQITRYGDYVKRRVAKAMEDGIITDDEDRVIQLAVEQLNRMTTRISEAQTEAHLQAIQLKYGGADLDEATFTQLQEEIGQYVDESSDAALQAYETTISSYYAKIGTDGYTNEQYEKDNEEAKLAYYENRAEYVSKGTEYLTNAIADAYPNLQSELERAGSDIDLGLSELFGNYSDLLLQADPANWQHIMDKFTEDVQISDSAMRGAIRTLYEQMEPMKAEMEKLANEYQEAGMEIPKALVDGLNEINTLGALSGDADVIYEMMQREIGNNEQYQELLETAKEQGAYLPESISDAISENQMSVARSIDGMYAYSNRYLNEVFAKGFDVDADVRFTYNVRGNKNEPKSILDDIGSYTNPVTPHALGGIYDTPHIGMLAEAGPEAYIPLDGSRNAVSIWEKAGQMLGTIGTQSTDERLYAGMVMNAGTSAKTEAAGPSIQITYNPSIMINGDASKSEVREAVSLGKYDVLKIIKDYIDGQARVSLRRK